MIIPLHTEQHLRKDEARILAISRLPSNKTNSSIQCHLEAYYAAEDLFDIHDTTAKKYEITPNLAHRVEMHRSYAQKAHQLKLLALQSLSTLIS